MSISLDPDQARRLQRLSADYINRMKRKLIVLFLNQNICSGYSKEPSHCDGSFETRRSETVLLSTKKKNDKTDG